MNMILDKLSSESIFGADFTILQPILTPAGGGIAMNMGDHRVEFALTAAQTGGIFSLFHMDADFDAATPPHIHTREDETFYVLEGQFSFWVDGEILVANPGDTVFAPRDIPHLWRCISPEGGKALVLVTPGGFENFFIELLTAMHTPTQNAAHVPDGATNASVGAVFGKYGLLPAEVK
ncbi:MAG: hypothetical protein OHK0029_02950 [Armatimonadaceae bacterium]